MGKHGKRYAESAKLVDPKAVYSPADAVRLLKQMGRAKFDETVEVAIRLGIDSKQADQQIRGTVALPAGTGKSVGRRVFSKRGKGQGAHPHGAGCGGGGDCGAESGGATVRFEPARRPARAGERRG